MRTIKQLLILAGLVWLASCKKNVDVQADSASLPRSVTGTYSNGFFLINEGWYGHGTGEVNFYSYATDSLTDSVFEKANPTKNLNPATSTLEFGTIFNGNLYIISKVGGPLVVVDQNTLVESNRIAAVGTNDFRAFVGIDSTHGLLSTSSGIYPLSLPTLTKGTKLSGITGEIGDMIKSGSYVFVLSATSGVLVLNATTDSVVKTIAGPSVGFTKTADGTVWAAGGTHLLKINPTTLDTATVALPFTVYGSWYAWHPGSIAASDSAVFIANNAQYEGGTTVYKYIVGSSSSLSSPFVTVATGKELYGAGIGYDHNNNHLVVTTVQSGYGSNYAVNDLDIYNAGTGSLIQDLGYSGYWFPAIPVFH